MSITKLVVATQLALADKKGAAMVEYALLAALIAVVVAAALPALSGSMTGRFNAIANLI